MTPLLVDALVRASGVGDILQNGTALANLGAGGILGVIVIVLGFLHYKSDRREEERGDALLKLSQDLSDKFGRSLEINKTYQDIIEKMQNRKRNEDVG